MTLRYLVRIYVYMTTEDNMKVAINKAVTKHWDKMVQDSIRICGYNANQWAEDLLAFHIAELLTKKPLAWQYKLIVEDDALLNYMGKSMALGLKSSASPFWHQIRKPMYKNRELIPESYEYGEEFEDHINEEFDTAKKDRSKEECVEWALEQLNFYDRALIQQKFQQRKTYNEIKDYYGIPHTAVVKDTRAAVKKLKEYCKHFNP